MNGGSGIPVTVFDWIPPVFWLVFFVGCIVSINTDEDREGEV